MSKKLYGLLLPVLAIAALAMTAGTAQAAPHWYLQECTKVAPGTGTFNDAGCTEVGGTKEFEWDLTRLPFTSARKPASTFGQLKLTIVGGPEVTCNVLDEGTVWNETLATAGKDEITSFINNNCVANPACPGITITARGLPWKTELLTGPIRDEIKGVEVFVECPGVLAETFKGNLTPTVAAIGRVNFTAASGALESPAKLKATVSGNDFVRETVTGDAIWAANP